MRDHACKPVGYMKLRTCTETVFDDLICLINFMLNAVKFVTFIITTNNAELAIYNKYGYLNYSTRVLHQYIIMYLCICYILDFCRSILQHSGRCCLVHLSDDIGTSWQPNCKPPDR